MFHSHRSVLQSISMIFVCILMTLEVRMFAVDEMPYKVAKCYIDRIFRHVVFRHVRRI